MDGSHLFANLRANPLEIVFDSVLKIMVVSRSTLWTRLTSQPVGWTQQVRRQRQLSHGADTRLCKASEAEQESAAKYATNRNANPLFSWVGNGVGNVVGSGHISFIFNVCESRGATKIKSTTYGLTRKCGG
jgi:hypothetical protein